eukprot:m.355849 g.355849  ORF g.355849 m.355849 type:complete len:138 (-) comp16600_c0_seq10:22-435(-)
MKSIADCSSGDFLPCEIAAAGEDEEEIDLPEGGDSTGTSIILESVLMRDDVPTTIRFEAALAQYFMCVMTHDMILASIEKNVYVAQLVNLNQVSDETKTQWGGIVEQSMDEIVREADKTRTTMLASSDEVETVDIAS